MQYFKYCITKQGANPKSPKTLEATKNNAIGGGGGGGGSQWEVTTKIQATKDVLLFKRVPRPLSIFSNCCSDSSLTVIEYSSD